MQIKLKDKSVKTLPEKSTARDLAETLNLRGPDQALVAVVNGELKDLATTLTDGDEVILLNFDDSQGKEVFWHTSAHILAQAILRLYPDAQPTIGPPIENGFYYDFANLTISDEDFDKIEKEMKAVIAENHASVRENFASRKEALDAFSGNKYKCEIINEVKEGQTLSGYRQGEFFDLCRGPHLPNLGKVKALKLLKTSGAYWRGDSKNEMLTRIYGITFPERKQLLEYLERLELAKKRDHKIIGPKLDLFSLHEEAPGMPFIHPKGLIVWNALVEYLRDRLLEYRYIEIKTPSLMTKELWERSGHWANYKEHMYISEVEDREFAIKPMNCPGCMIFYKSDTRSYRDLPYRVAEIGHVHRFEPSGALSGLFRVRSFHQDDAHIFMRPEQIKDEILQVLKFADEIYSIFGLTYHLELSTKPAKGTIGSDEEWEQATEGLRSALDESGRQYRVNEGDGAFYGPKIDFHIRDAIGRTWQCGTVQLDMALPEKFELEYTAPDGSRQRPVMIHRALFGSIERFFGILIENFSGRFPLWLSPLQVRLLTVADRHEEYAQKLKDRLQKEGFHVDVDAGNESVSKKVREAQMMQINYIITIGDKELQSETINLRTRDNVVHGEMSFDKFLNAIKEERKNREITSPFTSDRSDYANHCSQ